MGLWVGDCPETSGLLCIRVSPNSVLPFILSSRESRFSLVPSELVMRGIQLFAKTLATALTRQIKIWSPHQNWVGTPYHNM